MTLEQLLNSPSVEELRKLSQKELEAILAPCLPKTRPELVKEERKKSSVAVKVLTKEEAEKKAAIERGKQKLREMGFNF